MPWGNLGFFIFEHSKFLQNQEKDHQPDKYSSHNVISYTFTKFSSEFFSFIQVSVTLETSEIINQRSIHPSRKRSPTITKVIIHWLLTINLYLYFKTALKLLRCVML